MKLLRSGMRVEPRPGVGNRRAEHGLGFLGAVRQGFGPFEFQGGPADVADVPQLGVGEAFQTALLEWLEAKGQQPEDEVECLRHALCAECADAPEIARAIAWVGEMHEARHDSMPLPASVAKHRAIAWAADQWTPQWLCGADQCTQTALALYRHSEALLVELEFDATVVPRHEVTFTGYALLVATRAFAAFPNVREHIWDQVIVVEDLPACEDWTLATHTSEGQPSSHGLVCICVQGLAFESWDGTGFVRARQFERVQRSHLVYQDAALVVARLWCRRAPFAALLPQADPAIEASLGRLPGVSSVRGSSSILFSNCHEDTLPTFLYHPLN